MRISELEQPIVGDIVEFETDPDTVVEGKIVGETEDGYIFEFSQIGYTELSESCAHGKYYCSTDKKYKCRQGPKQDRDVTEDAEPVDREFHLVKKLGRLGERIVQNPKLWDKYSEAIDNDSTDWIISLIQEGTGAMRDEVMHLSELFGEIGGGLGRIVDFAWAVKEGKWEKDFMNPYRQYKSQNMTEAHPNSKIYDKCWDGYKKVPGKKRGEQGSCKKVDEAEYQGRTVPLGKPMAGDVKKSKVYVRNEKGNVVKVNFGDPNMRIKKTSPKHRKSFRARHNCSDPGPRWKARYWSCRAW